MIGKFFWADGKVEERDVGGDFCPLYYRLPVVTAARLVTYAQPDGIPLAPTATMKAVTFERVCSDPPAYVESGHKGMLSLAYSIKANIDALHHVEKERDDALAVLSDMLEERGQKWVAEVVARRRDIVAWLLYALDHARDIQVGPGQAPASILALARLIGGPKETQRQVDEAHQEALWAVERYEAYTARLPLGAHPADPYTDAFPSITGMAFTRLDPLGFRRLDSNALIPPPLTMHGMPAAPCDHRYAALVTTAQPPDGQLYTRTECPDCGAHLAGPDDAETTAPE